MASKKTIKSKSATIVSPKKLASKTSKKLPKKHSLLDGFGAFSEPGWQFKVPPRM